MKRLLALMLVLGGVLVMVTGCTVFADKQSDEAQVKQDMKPFFDFLAEENKDFSKVKSYTSRILVQDKDGHRTYDITSENGQTIYQIKDEDRNVIQETSVSIVNNQLVYEDTSIEPFPNDWFFVTIPTSVIDQAEVTDVMASHPDTYMKTLTLKIKDNPLFIQNLKNQSRITTEEDINMYLRKRSEVDYSSRLSLTSIQAETNSPKSITYYIFVTFE